MFKCHQEMDSLLLARGGQADIVVEISLLSGSDGVLSVHLDETTVSCSPLMRCSSLEQIHQIVISAATLQEEPNKTITVLILYL